MKTIKSITIGIIAALATSCGDMLDNIRPYIDNGEKIYVGKVDSLGVRSGRHRIEIYGNLPYGMTQTKCVLTWQHPSGDAQERSIDIVRTSADDKFSVVLDNMLEGPYEFTAVTYDSKGNHSVPETVNGYVYGDSYAASLMNRTIDGAIITSYEDNNFVATVTWIPINYDDAQGSYLTYELADGSGTATIFVEKTATVSKIIGAKPGGEFKWWTAYKPVEDAIDTFSSVETTANSTTQYQIPIVNGGNPFQYDERGLAVYGRFGYVKDWTANAQAELNGNFDTWGGRNSMSLWTYGGYSPAGEITNAKIYQKITLPAGNYRFDLHLDSWSSNGATYDIYAAVATGIADGLPDVSAISTAVASAKCPDDVVDKVLSVEFTLDSAQEVSFGVVANVGGNADINIKYVELWGV